MPNFRIISEADTQSALRKPRGTQLRGAQQRQLAVVSAGTLLAAARLAPADRRIISIEEILPGPSYTDEQLTRVLTSPTSDYADSERLEVAAFKGQRSPLLDSEDFVDVACRVADALREDKLIPGLELTLASNRDLVIDYAMVEIHDDVRGIYLSRGCDFAELTADRRAAGWAGVLAIARALLNITADLH